MIAIGQHYEVNELVDLVLSGTKAQLTPDSIHAICTCYDYLHEKIKREEKPIYGINTGFGSLCNTEIAENELQDLQENLLKSHACGMGDEVPEDIVRLMLILKAQSLSKGFSGVHLNTVQLLIECYNRGISPVVYELGSLGASGDLAPLANMSLALIGIGEVYYNGKKTTASKALESAGLTALRLEAKEGLALINGTQFMQAYGAFCIYKLTKNIQHANQIACLSLDAFNCSLSPFLPQTHQIRPHPGQKHVAAFVYENLKDSPIANKVKNDVQDPYSFRCVPQVHGATMDALAHIERIFETEINAVTDNPNVFSEDDLIISAGNFHGQTLALQLDYLAIAASELSNISERRIYKLVSGERGLPAYLTKQPGVNSGFMIAQYAAAAVVSQNKQLCTPASVDSIVSSNGQEDHVSMGANAATKALRVLQNVERVLTVELLTASQAIEFVRPAKSSSSNEALMVQIRKHVSFIEQDVYLGEVINQLNKDEILK
jgi:histidine ammonia-lyase